jgi:hypothetical protein
MMPMLVLMIAACGDRAADFRPVLTDVPAVVDLGLRDIVTLEERESAGFDPRTSPNVIYDRLGAPENPGIFGGATMSFLGTGGPVCVVFDPEAVFWFNQLDTDTLRRYRYRDHIEDDGDADLSVGLTAYYTGSPGVAMGDFNAGYDDALGTSHTMAFNECVQVGRFGDTNVHSGRGTTEFCEIDTDQRAGIPFTVVVRTFALPIDDSVLSYGLAVYEGSCDDIEPSECTLPDEVDYAEPNGRADDAPPVAGKEWFARLERAVCQGPGAVNEVCEDPELNDLDVPPCGAEVP